MVVHRARQAGVLRTARRAWPAGAADRALYQAEGRFAAVPVFAEPAALAAHLRAGMRYPFFGKPVAGIRSIGVAAVERYDAAGDALVFMGGRTLALDGFVKEIEPYRKQGYLLQEMLRPHSEVAALCGPRVSTVRLIVLLEDGAPAVFHALWKIPVGANPADNFWRPGNLLAALDADGCVTRVIQGTGADQTELDRHPDTEQPLIGAMLPDWTALIGLCLKAAKALPGLRMQAWDIALTDRGPVLVEVNIGGDFNLPQLAHATGLMDERFRTFLERCANGSA
jgi:Sugar-transfer associated ATP-grasp